MKQPTCQHCHGTGVEIDDRKMGNDMRTMRENADASAKDVAQLMGISQSFLCDLEYGRRRWLMVHFLAFNNAITKLSKKTKTP